MTQLFKKLNLGSQAVLHILNTPESFEKELIGWATPEIRRALGPGETTEFALAFAKTQRELDELSRTVAAAAEGDVVVWFAYPKGTSKRYRCDFNRDTGWTVLADAGFEPVRQVAIDEDWSALRFRRVAFIKTLTRDASRALTAEGKSRTKPG